MALSIQEFKGRALQPHIDDLGALRIAVFREYPYLYDGTLDYEREYLQSYLNSERSMVALVFDDARIVGATTCMPMIEEGPEFQEPFVKHGQDLTSIFYFGESILLPEYRGRGIGKEFFARRETHARTLGAWLTTFCAVDRPADHPLRPAGYAPLDAFWAAQGYTKQHALQCTFVWKEIDEAAESPKKLTFWTKSWK